MDIYQLAMNGKADALIGALDAEPSVLQRPQKGGLYDSRTLLHCAAGKGVEEMVSQPSIMKLSRQRTYR